MSEEELDDEELEDNSPNLEDIIKALEHDLEIIDDEKIKITTKDLRKVMGDIVFTLIQIFKSAKGRTQLPEGVQKSIQEQISTMFS